MAEEAEEAAAVFLLPWATFKLLLPLRHPKMGSASSTTR